MNHSKSYLIEAIIGKDTIQCKSIALAEEVVRRYREQQLKTVKARDIKACTMVSRAASIDYDVLNGLEAKAY